MSRLPPRSVRGRAPLALAHPTTRTARGADAPRCQVIMLTNEKSQVPQMRYLTFLAGAEGLEPSARGFGVDVERTSRERGRAVLAVFFTSLKTGGAVLMLRRKNCPHESGQIASFRGSSTTGQDSYCSQRSRSKQAAGSRFSSKSQAIVSLRTIKRSRKMASSHKGMKTPSFSSREGAVYRRTVPS